MANMSHELRAPLNAIIGFSKSMKEEIFGSLDSVKNREYMSDIHQSGQHLLERINDILDVSTIAAGALHLQEEHVNLSEVIEIARGLIRPRAETGQVKISNQGGEVSVTVQINDDGALTIVVADSGIGMNEEEILTALSTFGQADSGLDRKHEGTGLGLPLTKGLVELHCGTMELKSKSGEGTEVTVILPKERVDVNAA